MSDTVPLGTPGLPDRRVDPLIGTLLNKIEIVRPLDAGGMGTIYLGINRELDKQYAIKVASNETDPSLVGRSLLEAKALSTLDHPNIVQVFDAWTLKDGRLAIVMPLLSGQSLEKHIGARPEGWSRPLPLTEALLIGLQLANGLDEAHRHGLVHRDLKPGNVFLTTREIELAHFRTLEVKILDFGLVRTARSQQIPLAPGAITTSGPLKTIAMGTPEYVSPEQASGSPHLDHRADLYSLGALLFQLLTGRLPFLAPRGLTREKEAARLLQSQREEPAPKLTAWMSEAPEALETLISELMEKLPERRPASAKLVGARLRELLESLPHTVTPARETSVAPRRRSRGWVVPALAALGLVAVVAVAGWWRAPKAPPPVPPLVVADEPPVVHPLPEVNEPSPTPEPPVSEPVPQPELVVPPTAKPATPRTNSRPTKRVTKRAAEEPCEADDRWRKTMLANLNELGRLAQDNPDAYSTFKAGEARLSSLVRTAATPLECGKANRLFEELKTAVSSK